MAGSSKVIRLVDAQRGSGPRAEDAAALVRALRAGEPWAERAFLEGQSALVERILTRILGGHSDLDDLTQEVFVRAFERIEELREPAALRGWLTAITVYVAREAIRKKQRRRWLILLPTQQTPEVLASAASPEARAALRACYEVLASFESMLGSHSRFVLWKAWS